MMYTLSRNAKSSINRQFKTIVLSFIRLKEESIYAKHDSKGIKLLTRLAIKMNLSLGMDDMDLGIQLILLLSVK